MVTSSKSVRASPVSSMAKKVSRSPIKTMLAVRVHHFGGPEELSTEQVQVPDPRPGEALVRVHAAGVGPWDALIRAGQSGVEQALPLTPGSDIAGVVESIPAR